MKNLFAFLLISSFSFSQVNNQYVVTSRDSMQVYILNDDFGKLIYASWQANPYYNNKKPNVYLVNNLNAYRKRVLYKKRK